MTHDIDDTHGARSTDTRRGGTLYVVGTPIGNLDDLSPRARDVLGRVSAIAAEDTRRTSGLLSTIGLKKPLIAFHEHNEDRRADALLARLAEGESLALVSDAGMPLISDPGWRLVERALEAGFDVRTVPGPSAVTAALSVSGLPTDRYVFEGFLPRRAQARDARLDALRDEDRTLVFFESVHRMPETIDALVRAFGPTRRACVARELTKVHEQIFRGSLEAIRRALGDAIPLLGEFVLVVAGRPATEGDESAADVRRVFDVLRRELPPGRAAALTAELTGVSRNVVYRLTQVEE
ncbi:MAG TPA: 16S rRNA (cytidine(1402)-2'-O)-methyltransferase [Gammaproteobacteria bacterium]